MEYLPREDGFPSGFALGKTILPRETFHHGIPSGMSYLYNILSMYPLVLVEAVSYIAWSFFAFTCFTSLYILVSIFAKGQSGAEQSVGRQYGNLVNKFAHTHNTN